MNRPHVLWRALEQVPGVEAVLADWRARVGPDFASVKQLFLPLDQEAGSYPKSGGWGIPYNVVKHGPNDFTGIPPEGGDVIQLSRADVLIYRFDHHRLGKELADTFEFQAVIEEVSGIFPTWRLGTAAASDGSVVPVHLVIPGDSDHLHRAIEVIAFQCGRLGIVLTPTRRYLRTEAERLIQRTNGHFLALEDALPARESGRWQVAPDVVTGLKKYLNPADVLVDEPIGDRCQCVLMAMLELVAFDSDSRQSAGDIAAKAFGRDYDANAIKSVMSELKDRSLIDTKTGRNGGNWLTERGWLRAEKLRGRS